MAAFVNLVLSSKWITFIYSFPFKWWNWFSDIHLKLLWSLLDPDLKLLGRKLIKKKTNLHVNSLTWQLLTYLRSSFNAYKMTVGFIDDEYFKMSHSSIFSIQWDLQSTSLNSFLCWIHSKICSSLAYLCTFPHN